MRATYAFGRGLMCGGLSGADIPVRTCLFYQCWNDFDTNYDSWFDDYYYDDNGQFDYQYDRIAEVGFVLFHDIPSSILWQADTIFRQNHRDIYWWHTGGFSK